MIPVWGSSDEKSVYPVLHSLNSSKFHDGLLWEIANETNVDYK